MTGAASPRGYDAFIAAKRRVARPGGFHPGEMPDGIAAHQRHALEFACRSGRAALFLDTGLGKSRCEAVFAARASAETGRPSLILTPLAVARQMQRECRAVGVDAAIVREASDQTDGVQIANYERLDKLDLTRLGGIVLDESSILKSFTGATRTKLIADCAHIPYRVAATATPAPNDIMELTNHAEWLGILRTQEVLSRWFVNDTATASQKWRLKGHAERSFWEWVGSWAVMAGMPSDIGGDDDGYILPPLRHHLEIVATDWTTGRDDGALFRMPDSSATAIHREKRMTMADRVCAAARIAERAEAPCVVWCQTNAESKALATALPGAVEVTGSMPIDDKEAALDRFSTGDAGIIVTKPSIAGFGLNWQHASVMVFASISHSYEQYYQAIRRLWRFGQRRPVDVHVVIADTELSIWRTIERKAADHIRLAAGMARAGRLPAERSAWVAPMPSERPSGAVALPRWINGGTTG